MDFKQITEQAKEAAEILLDAAKPEKGMLCVIGCSTSTVKGERIGSASSEEIAAAIMDGLLPVLLDAGLYVAVQGCEHINRSLCVTRECLEKFSLQQVWVEPWLHAGGAFVTEAKKRFENAVMVENLDGKAALGMDIGDTLIGMHLRPVVVPVHTDFKKIGEANLVLARTRPKYVGGPRAHYSDNCDSH